MAGKFAENGNLKSDINAIFQTFQNVKTKLPFLSGSIKSTFSLRHGHKANFFEKKQNKLDFSFSSFHSPFFFVLISFLSLVAGLSLDFIYEVKVSPENAEESEI